MIENPIRLSFIDGGIESYVLADHVDNNGMKLVYIPNIETTLGQFEVRAKDAFGNITHDLSDEYIVIGIEDFFYQKFQIEEKLL